MKKIAILGSTGSIGTQTLEVVENNGDIQVTALAAGSNIVLFRAADPEIPSEAGLRVGREKGCRSSG